MGDRSIEEGGEEFVQLNDDAEEAATTPLSRSAASFAPLRAALQRRTPKVGLSGSGQEAPGARAYLARIVEAAEGKAQQGSRRLYGEVRQAVAEARGPADLERRLLRLYSDTPSSDSSGHDPALEEVLSEVLTLSTLLERAAVEAESGPT